MRFTAASLVLINLIVLLLVTRIPEPRSPQPPITNLPRVSEIELVGPEHDLESGEKRGETCFRVAGFLSRSGATDWLLAHGLTRQAHLISRATPVARKVLRLGLRHSVATETISLPHGVISLSERALSLENLSAGRYVFGALLTSSEVIANLSSYQYDKKGIFRLEEAEATFYSYAVEGAEPLQTAWNEGTASGRSQKLRGGRCQSIAKPRKNP